MNIEKFKHYAPACIRVFLLMIFVDFFWAKYITETASGNAFIASTWATILFVSSGFVTVEYVKNKWLLIPAGIGAFIGTYLGIFLK